MELPQLARSFFNHSVTGYDLPVLIENDGQVMQEEVTTTHNKQTSGERTTSTCTCTCTSTYRAMHRLVFCYVLASVCDVHACVAA